MTNLPSVSFKKKLELKLRERYRQQFSKKTKSIFLENFFWIAFPSTIGGIAILFMFLNFSSDSQNNLLPKDLLLLKENREIKNFMNSLDEQELNQIEQELSNFINQI